MDNELFNPDPLQIGHTYYTMEEGLAIQKWQRESAEALKRRQPFYCEHRGEHLEVVDCALCGGRDERAQLYSCAIYGKCTIHSHGIRLDGPASPKIAVCVACADLSSAS